MFTGFQASVHRAAESAGWSGDEVLRNEAAYQETLANLVRREVEWLRRGAKARTTKAKARIQNAERLIDEAWRFARVGEFANAEAMLQDALAGFEGLGLDWHAGVTRRLVLQA